MNEPSTNENILTPEFKERYLGRHDKKFDTKRSNTLLYLHTHPELPSIPKYYNAFEALQLYYFQADAYCFEEKLIHSVTDDDRLLYKEVLREWCLEYTPKELERFQKDAKYIANRIAKGYGVFPPEKKPCFLKRMRKK